MREYDFIITVSKALSISTLHHDLEKAIQKTVEKILKKKGIIEPSEDITVKVQ